MQTSIAINPETPAPAKDLGHRHYNGKGIVHSVESCGAVDVPDCATSSSCKAASCAASTATTATHGTCTPNKPKK